MNQNYNTTYKSKNKADNDNRDLKLNSRMFDRSFTNMHDDSINRTMMEREDFFTNSEKIVLSDNQPKRTYINRRKNNTSGEITGEDFDMSNIDQGMPLRSQFIPKRNDIDIEKSYNKYLDFNIFDDEQPESKLEVNYFDPNGGSMFNFSDIGKSNLAKKSDPIYNMTSIINDYNFFIYENLRNLMNTTTLISTHSIIDILSSLYISSKGNTDGELKNYLSLMDKDSTYAGCVGVKKYIDRSQCYDFKNIILLDKSVPVNSEFIQYIQPISQCFTVNKNNSQHEAQKLNNYLNSQYNNIFGSIFRSDHIENLDVTCLTVGLLRTVWKNPFDKVIQGKFFGKTSTVKSMMYASKKIYNYFEDSNLQVLEMNLYDSILSMGIILPKQTKNQLPQISLNDFDSIMEGMKPTVINEIVIPEFRIQSKMRIANILKKTGMTQLFEKAELPELLSKSSRLTDFVQNFTIIVENKYVQNNNQNTNSKSSVLNQKFIANKPFIFYFKLLQTNTVVIIGQYYG